TELFGIDNHDEITGIDVRRVNGFVLAAQTEGDFTGHPPEDLLVRVNHKPLMRHVSRLCAEGFHESLKKLSPPGARLGPLLSRRLSSVAHAARHCVRWGATGQPWSIAYTKHAEEEAIGALRGLRAD